MVNRAVEGYSDSSWHDPNLREGFTTGSCAAAAAAAATRTLVTGQIVTAITIDLPVRKNVTFEVKRCEIQAGRALCGVIKDAGDDPDVTHGAEIQAAVRWNNQSGEIIVERGEGVGLVTKPGLPIDVGEPAINPVPRKMIRRSVIREAGVALDERGLTVTISVPGGEEIAKETLNPRLGIVGGISILGTTGIVKPFSTSAYRASVYIELKVAAQNHAPAAVLTTGSRSEQYAMDRYPAWPELAFIQVGDHMDYGLKQARRLKFNRVVISGMIGKISKLAQGRMQTHISQGEVDFDFLAQIAGQLGADDTLTEQIREANTAHHVQVMLDKAGIPGIESKLAQMAAEQAAIFVGRTVGIEVLVWDMKGNLLAIGGSKS